MAPRRTAPLRVVTNPRPAPLVSNAVLGTLIFIFTETMLFAGLISAHTITRASSAVGWPPPGQPRLPVENTAVNTAALLLSGAVVFYAQRRFRRDRQGAFMPLVIGIALGAFFYLIVGVHGLHALGALAALGWSALRLRRSVLPPGAFHAATLFWYFVVGIWPIIYLRVYL